MKKLEPPPKFISMFELILELSDIEEESPKLEDPPIFIFTFISTDADELMLSL